MTTENIAKRLEEIYQGEPWFGESIQTKLKSITGDKAYYQPVNNKHSIAEILGHMEFWRKSFILQLKGEDSSAFNGDSPDNWPSVEELKKRGWKNQISSFEETHRMLVGLLKSHNKTLNADLMNNLNGLVDHDIYHLGQIGMVKSLTNGKSN